ncbi:MAG: hypothetical protein LBL35_05480 [Clostridiales bacterium]|nr:hypothetical protein [Clostridiales bacterium]
MEPLRKNERLVMAGTIHREWRSAEARYAAMAGADSLPLYIKEGAENINPKTRLSLEEEKTCEPLIRDLLEAFAQA